MLAARVPTPAEPSSPLHPRGRVLGVDPAQFWARPLTHTALTELIAKYEALAGLARMPDTPERKLALRRSAHRWPGSLREAELIGPQRVDERLLIARAALELPEQPRERWLASASVVLVAWAELHGLLADLARFRARTRREAEADRATGERFVAWLTDLPFDAPEHARWPVAARIVDVIGPRPSTRGMYLWLAARMGLGLPVLNRILLARSGGWDRRPGDPEWAHDDQP